jgi:hypothetical protein
MDERVAAGLANTIKALRAELTDAMVGGEGNELRFVLGPVTLDVALAITKDAGGKFGVGFGVLSLGAKGGVTNEATNRLKVSLQPMLVAADGITRQVMISDKVAGEPK